MQFWRQFRAIFGFWKVVGPWDAEGTRGGEHSKGDSGLRVDTSWVFFLVWNFIQFRKDVRGNISDFFVSLSKLF